jgi:hypothetical protein
MKTIEQTIQQADPVIREVWRTKREIMTEHGGSLDSLFAELRSLQAQNPRLVKTKRGEQAGTEQPATRPESDSEGGDKPQPESEGRSR